MCTEQRFLHQLCHAPEILNRCELAHEWTEQVIFLPLASQMPQQALRRGEPSQKHGSNQVLCQIELYTAAFVKKSWSLKFSVCMFSCIPIYTADLYRAMCSKTPGAAFTNPRLAEHLPGQTQPQIQGTKLPGHSPHHLQWHHQPQGKSGWFKITAIFIYHIYSHKLQQLKPQISFLHRD